MTVFDPVATTQTLARAWHDRVLMDALPPAQQPVDLAQAYAVQSSLRDQLGEDAAGWKVAGASPAGLRASQFGVALFGYLPSTRMHTSPASMAQHPAGPYTLEVEVAVVFGRAVRPAEETLDITSMISGAHLAIEIVRSRYVDRTKVGAPSFIADNSAFHAFVRGDALPGEWDIAALQERAVLMRDGVEFASALNGDALTNPAASLTLFWEHAAQQDLVVPSGAVVTTGTLTVATDAHQPGDYEARLGPCRVSLQLTR